VNSVPFQMRLKAAPEPVSKAVHEPGTSTIAERGNRL
jgi:hypothetical protein